jgi:hypothetical protein
MRRYPWTTPQRGRRAWTAPTTPRRTSSRMQSDWNSARRPRHHPVVAVPQAVQHPADQPVAQPDAHAQVAGGHVHRQVPSAARDLPQHQRVPGPGPGRDGLPGALGVRAVLTRVPRCRASLSTNDPVTTHPYRATSTRSDDRWSATLLPCSFLSASARSYVSADTHSPAASNSAVEVGLAPARLPLEGCSACRNRYLFCPTRVGQNRIVSHGHGGRQRTGFRQGVSRVSGCSWRVPRPTSGSSPSTTFWRPRRKG